MIRHTDMILALELVSKQRNLLILLRRYRGTPTDYNFVVNDKIMTAVTIVGTLFPQVIIASEGTAPVDLMAGKRSLLREHYRIPCLTAIWARHMLSKPYISRLVWITQNNDVTQANVEKYMGMRDVSGMTSIDQLTNP